MNLPHIVIYDRTEYVWTGKSWYAKADFMKPPVAIMIKLNNLIDEDLKAEDEKLFKNFDPKIVMEVAYIAKSCLQKQRVERLLIRAYSCINFLDSGIASMLSSFYREIGNTSKAIEVYGAFKGKPSVALQTSYAAALCDEKRYKEGLKQVRRALAIAHSQGNIATEAFNVHSRIKKEAPILFESPEIEAAENVFIAIPGVGEKCPLCSGQLTKRRNQETGEYFLGCNHYPECKYSRAASGL